MKKVMIVVGTRPEAIKMFPVIIELYKRHGIRTIVCSTGQHKEMLNDVLNLFGVKVDYDLNIMKEGQDLRYITETVLHKICGILKKENPDVVLVHGDTTSAMATAVACFYSRIKVGHVEAGLRTEDINDPYPEEFNRRVIGLISRLDFAPTDNAKANLIKEGKPENYVYVTGNTVIDSLQYTIKDNYFHSELQWSGDKKIILITAHRRENIGKPMIHMFRGIKRILYEFPDVKAIFPIHPNPLIRDIARTELGGCPNLHIIEPLSMIDFQNILYKSYLVLTDSGGIQEEAVSLGKPVFVMRQKTERPEGVQHGGIKLVGNDEASIYNNFKVLISNPGIYKEMSKATTVYGDGRASQRIVDILMNSMFGKE